MRPLLRRGDILGGLWEGDKQTSQITKHKPHDEQSTNLTKSKPHKVQISQRAKSKEQRAKHKSHK